MTTQTFSTADVKLPFPKFDLTQAHNPYSFIVYADIQDIYENGHQKLVHQMEKQNVAMIFNTGDISPNDGKNLEGQFHSEIQELATQIPFFPAIGNHDVEFRTPQSRASFLNYFKNVYDYLSGQPLNQHLAGTNNQRLWYAFRYATSLFLILDSNLIINSGRYKDTNDLPPYHGFIEEQFQFAREVLAKADQDPRIKSKFVLFHHSPFLSKENTSLFGMGGHEDDRGLMVGHAAPSTDGNGKEYLLDLIRKYNVTAVFSGHEHYYERWVETIDEGNGKSRDLNWVVAGSGGVKPRENIEYGDKNLAELFEDGELYDSYLDRITNINPRWSAKMERVFPTREDPLGSFQNYLIVHVDGTNVRFETIDTSAMTRDSGYFSRATLADATTPDAETQPTGR
jgi:hypothetical protein